MAAWRLDRTFDYLVPEDLRARVQIGSAVRVPLGARRVRGVVVSLSDPRDDRALQSIHSVLWDVPLVPPALQSVVEGVAQRYVAPRGAVYARLLPPRVRVEVGEPTPLRGAVGTRELTRYEGGAELIDAISRGEAGSWCVVRAPRADAGALIVEVLSAAVDAPGTAIVTVPEVHYGSLTLERIARTFPTLARVDSAQPERDRARSWLRLASGHGLGGGGRAAVLAPSPRLRLLVVDEEHDSTYKEDRSPRYDARWVAQERARTEGAICVFVSKTPSLELGWRIKQGLCRSVIPPRALRRASRPLVEVVAPPREGWMGPALHERIRDALRAGERAALLVPARGYARSVWCVGCRRSLRCPVCESGVALQRRGPTGSGEIRCPRCGYSASLPRTCPRCGASDWRLLGTGSERAAEQIARAFPRARVARADPETVSEVRGGAAPDIYVATWIGTKPSLRPEVSTVGVVNADALVRRPTFRAAERAYQALAEMAEWAGAAVEGGRLLIQSEDPSHHAVQAVVRNDYNYFLERELPFREELSYPPFTELIAVTSRGPERRPAIERAAAVMRDAGATVLGPIAATQPGRADALELLAKCEAAEPVAAALRAVVEEVPGGSTLRVDVDPR